MTRPTWLDSPFLLGFGRMQELAERAARATADGYPPYNIEDVGEGAIRITLAVAGFRPDELCVAVTGAQLVMRGDRAEPDDGAYIHRGIAARRFQRSFVLADGWEVVGALLKDGLLHIDVRWREVEPTERRIEIRTEKGDVGRSIDQGASNDAENRIHE